MLCDKNEKERDVFKLIYRKWGKRLVDILLSAVGLMILLLPLCVITVWIKLDSPGPVIFRQKRLGLYGKEFVIYKFRTMCVNAESIGGVYCTKGDSRVTRAGRVLRATSLDELPQLLNVLKGDMSFIGPRPPLTYHPWPIEEYTEEQRHMFDVRPGITGWAQVNGRKEVEWHKRIEMNVWYTEHMSFLLDVKILFMTIVKVFTNADNENKDATVVAEEKQAEHAGK